MVELSWSAEHPAQLGQVLVLAHNCSCLSVCLSVARLVEESGRSSCVPSQLCCQQGQRLVINPSTQHRLLLPSAESSA